MAIKTQGSIKRFGARYGRTIRSITGGVEHKQRKLYKCPYCRKVSAKRESVGIWLCRNCGSKFTGRSYEVIAEKVSKEKKKTQEAPIESIEKEKDEAQRYKAESEIKR